MKRIKLPGALAIFLPCFTFLSSSLQASPAARAIAYHTTLRFLNLQSGIRTNFLKSITQSMLSSVKQSSNHHKVPIYAHLEASSLAWRNAKDNGTNLTEVYENSYEIALDYLSKHKNQQNILDETFRSFEGDLENIRRPW